MPALLMADRRPSNAGDFVDHERLRTPGRVMACGDHPAPTPIVPRRELLRVLVVDDYRATADTMSSLVATWGHDVRRAYHGATGMALAAAFQPDVLLLDLIMSGASGLALAQQMQRQARLKNCLLIAITGRTDAKHRLQCEEAGIDLFLVKPVELSFLRTLLAVESEYLLQARQLAGAQSFCAQGSCSKRILPPVSLCI